MQKIKVLIILPSLRRCGPVLGGVALAKYIKKENCEISIGCLSRFNAEYKPLADDLQSLGINICWFGIPGWLGLLKTDKVKRFILNNQIDIMHSYGIRPDIISVLSGNRCIRIASIRGMFRDEYRLKYGALVAFTFAFLHIKALMKMDCIVAISNAMRDWLIDEGLEAKKVTYIANFVDKFEIGHVIKDDVRVSSGQRDRPINIGFWGKFIRNKRVGWLVSALSDLRRKYPELDITLHLAGDGPFQKKIRRQVSKLALDKSVLFYGYVNNIGEILKRIDLAVLASRTEGIPRMLMEAMSLGITCIGPSIGGVNELIKDGETGYFFDSNSYEDLVQKMEHVICGNAFLDPMIVKRHIEDHFDARRGAEQTRLLYDRMVGIHSN